MKRSFAGLIVLSFLLVLTLAFFSSVSTEAQDSDYISLAASGWSV